MTIAAGVTCSWCAVVSVAGVVIVVGAAFVPLAGAAVLSVSGAAVMPVVGGAVVSVAVVVDMPVAYGAFVLSLVQLSRLQLVQLLYVYLTVLLCL